MKGVKHKMNYNESKDIMEIFTFEAKKMDTDTLLSDFNENKLLLEHLQKQIIGEIPSTNSHKELIDFRHVMIQKLKIEGEELDKRNIHHERF